MVGMIYSQYCLEYVNFGTDQNWPIYFTVRHKTASSQGRTEISNQMKKCV